MATGPARVEFPFERWNAEDAHALATYALDEDTYRTAIAALLADAPAEREPRDLVALVQALQAATLSDGGKQQGS